MKILLAAVNAKYIHSNLAVYNLKAYVSSLPVEVVVGEYTINQQSGDILQKIYEQKADVVAFSCYIWNIEMVRQLAEELKQVSPETKVWFGGPEVSYDASGLLKTFPYVDLILLGEGEETFYELVSLLAEGTYEQKVHTVKGTAFRDGEKCCIRPAREYMQMDRIPFVYQDTDAFAHKIIYYESSRGCPFACSYCLSSIDKRVRFRSLSLVFEELESFLDQNVAQVKFVDRTFNCRHDHAYAIWEFIAKRDNGVTNFHFEISADLLQEEDFALFETMRPGLIQLEIGVQSTNPDTIAAIHRKMDLAALADHVARIRKMHNIHQHLDLIAGLPYENLQRFSQSFDDVYAMQPDQLQLGFLKVLKGSDMYCRREEYGVVYTSRPPYEVLQTKWLSYEDVLVLKGIEEMVEVYYNSGQYQKTLSFCLPYFERPYCFYEKLSAFYKKKGYFEKSHTRLARYDILREFLYTQWSQKDEAGAMRLKQAEECLLFDIFAYEHSKRYPSWAVLEEQTKEVMNGLKNPKYRQEHIPMECLKQVDPVLKKKADSYVSYLPLTRGGYVLFDYSDRNPLTNEAKSYRLVIQ